MSNEARLAVLILVGVAAACGPKNNAQPLKDGSWEVQCEDQVDRCVREAQRVCGDEEYHVVSGKKEEQIYGGQTGYQTGVDLHTIVFRCGSDPAVWKLERKDEPVLAEPEASPPAAAPKALCAPGSTQRCVGPGACEGGQSCNADGMGYSPCDCGAPSSEVPPAGPTTPPGSAPPASSTSPTGSAAPTGPTSPAGPATPVPVPSATPPKAPTPAGSKPASPGPR